MDREEEEHHDGVEGAPQEDEDMEDLMPGEIASGWQLVLEREEENADCVGDPATGEEDQHGWGKTLGEGVESDEYKPAHEEVEDD